MNGASPPRTGRLGFIDGARALAMMLMIQGHVCDTLLSQAGQASSFYRHYQLFRGVSAPLFFMLSGFAFVVASDPHWDDYARLGPALWARLKRAGMLMAVGWFLQWPRFQGLPPFDFTAAEWQYLLRTGVLHAIAWSLLLGHGLLAATRTRRRFTLAALASAALVAGLAAPVAAMPGTFPLPLEMMLRGKSGSLFPVLPWAAHFLVGAVLARLFLDVAWLRAPRRMGVLLAAGAAGLATAAGLWHASDPAKALAAAASNAELQVVLSKAASAWTVFAIVALALGPARSSRALKAVSSSALSIYFFHLLILYGPPSLPGLASYWGTALSVGQAFAVGPLVMAGSVALALGWGRVWGAAKALPERLRLARRPVEAAEPEAGP